MELVPTEDRLVFSDGTYTMEELYATMSPTRLLDEMYFKQIGPIRSEHASQMIGVYGLGNQTVAAAKSAVLELLNEKVETGEIDEEMAEIAKEEFGLMRLVKG